MCVPGSDPSGLPIPIVNRLTECVDMMCDRIYDVVGCVDRVCDYVCT